MQNLQFVLFGFLFAVLIQGGPVKEPNSLEALQFLNALNFEKETSNYTFVELLRDFEILNSDNEVVESKNEDLDFVVLDSIEVERRSNESRIAPNYFRDGSSSENSSTNETISNGRKLGNDSNSSTTIPITQSELENSTSKIIILEQNETTTSGSIRFFTQQFLFGLFCYILLI